MTGVELILGALAVARCTVLLVDDYIFEPLRDWIDYRADRSQRSRCGRSYTNRAWVAIQYAITGGATQPHGCPWCVSLWFGAAWVTLWAAAPAAVFAVLAAPFAWSQIAGALHRYTHEHEADE